MHVERLTKLAELLDRVEAEKKPFDIWFWYTPNTNHPCGFAACAVGHAMVDPWFISQGLTKNYEHNNGPHYNDKYEMEAVQEFFSLSSTDADTLFAAECYDYDPTAADVAAKIRQYLARDQEPEYVG
jgi:hypothetical protein